MQYSVVLLLFVTVCSANRCAEKVTRRDDLIFRILNEYRSRHEDTPPLKCLQKKGWFQSYVDERAIPIERKENNGYIMDDHMFYYRSNTWDGDLEKEIVQLLNWAYSEINRMYQKRPDNKVFHCKVRARYAAIVWRDTKEVVCAYKSFPGEKWMNFSCRFFPNKPRFETMKDDVLMKGHGLPKDRDKNNLNIQGFWNSCKYRGYEAVMRKYLEEVESAKKKGSGYWDEVIDPKWEERQDNEGEEEENQEEEEKERNKKKEKKKKKDKKNEKEKKKRKDKERKEEKKEERREGGCAVC